MAISRRALVVLTLLLAIPLVAAIAMQSRSATAQTPPILASPNVELVGSVQGKGTVGISGVFSRTAPYFYTSGADSVSVFDVSDPEDPKLTGKLVNAVFENEAMTMGERIENGKIRRFVLIGNDLANVTLNRDDVPHVGRANGQEMIVVDVTDPADPKDVGRTPSTGPDAVTTSTHTIACMNAACTVAYTAGGREGTFSVLDLTDLSKPKQVKEVKSAAAGPNAVFETGAGHHWNVDGSGIAWHTGSGGAEAYDVSDPLSPTPVNATDAKGVETPWNDFILHNSQRPNAAAFGPGKEPSLVNGNVLLVTEEDYVNDGDEVACDRAGTFQTWEIPDMDGAAYRASNPDQKPSRGTIRPLDIINAPNEAGGGLTTPVGGFCSAHWFDYHQSGIVAQGYYQQGMRLIDARNPRDLKQFGYFTGGGGEVWDAYWVPQRDASGAVVPGKKTNLIYTVDAVRGLEVLRVNDLPADLPVSGDEGARGAFPAPVGEGGASSSSRTGAPCAAPGSKFTRGNRIGAKGIRLRGLALARGRCAVRRVEVAVARRSGKRCRFLKASGRLGARRSCAAPQFLRATGTRRWSYRLALRLPRGRYLAYSRAVDSAGTVETWGKSRKILRARVR